MNVIPFEYVGHPPARRELVKVEEYREDGVTVEPFRLPGDHIRCAHYYSIQLGVWRWDSAQRAGGWSLDLWTYPLIFYFSDGSLGMARRSARRAALEALGCQQSVVFTPHRSGVINFTITMEEMTGEFRRLLGALDGDT